MPTSMQIKLVMVSQVLCIASHSSAYCIVSTHLYSAYCSAHQSEALPVRESAREESSLERTKRSTWLTS